MAAQSNGKDPLAHYLAQADLAVQTGMEIDVLSKRYVNLSLAAAHVTEADDSPNSLDMYFCAEEQHQQVAAVMKDKAGWSDVAPDFVGVDEALQKVKRQAVRCGLAELMSQVETFVDKADEEKNGEFLYRGTWIQANTHAMLERMKYLLGERHALSFKEQLAFYYDLEGIAVQDWDFPLEQLPQTKLDELDREMRVIEDSMGIAVAVGATPTLAERFDTVRKQFLIPQEKYEVVFMRALEECKRRCEAKGLVCPPLPKMTWHDDPHIEWEAFEGFKGEGQSEMQVNKARLISLDKALQLPAHEAYPGHHYMFTAVEEHLYREKGWAEFSVVNTFSPYSFVAEGGAEWAAQELLWCSMEDRKAYMQELSREALASRVGGDASAGPTGGAKCKLARVNSPGPEEVAAWCRVAAITDPLDEVGRVHVKIAQQLVDGEIDYDKAKQQMLEHGFRCHDSWPNADFLQSMGAYIVTYSFGKRMVERWIQRRVAESQAAGSPVDRWQAFAEFARRPVLPREM